MIFYLANGTTLCPTQAEAKALDKNFVQHDIPVDKRGLMTYVNDIMGVKDRENGQNVSYPPVVVTLETDNSVEVLARFDTVADAESFLATSATIDPDHLEAGHYGIDAPEELINPSKKLPPTYAAVTIAIDETWEALPLGRKLHFAALAMEDAREILKA